VQPGDQGTRRRSAALTDGVAVEVQPDGDEVLALLPPLAGLDRLVAAARPAGSPHRDTLAHEPVVQFAFLRGERFLSAAETHAYWARKVLI